MGWPAVFYGCPEAMHRQCVYRPRNSRSAERCRRISAMASFASSPVAASPGYRMRVAIWACRARPRAPGRRAILAVDLADRFLEGGQQTPAQRKPSPLGPVPRYFTPQLFFISPHIAVDIITPPRHNKSQSSVNNYFPFPPLRRGVHWVRTEDYP